MHDDDVKICALTEVHNGRHFILVYLKLQERNSVNAMDFAADKVDTSLPPDPEPWWAPDLIDFSYFLTCFARTVPPHKGQVFVDDWVLGLRDRPDTLTEMRRRHKQETVKEWRTEQRRLGLTVDEKDGPKFPKQTVCTQGRVLKNHRARHPDMADLPDEEILAWSDEVMDMLDDALTQERIKRARHTREY